MWLGPKICEAVIFWTLNITMILRNTPGSQKNLYDNLSMTLLSPTYFLLCFITFSWVLKSVFFLRSAVWLNTGPVQFQLASKMSHNVVARQRSAYCPLGANFLLAQKKGLLYNICKQGLRGAQGIDIFTIIFPRDLTWPFQFYHISFFILFRMWARMTQTVTILDHSRLENHTILWKQ